MAYPAPVWLGREGGNLSVLAGQSPLLYTKKNVDVHDQTNLKRKIFNGYI